MYVGERRQGGFLAPQARKASARSVVYIERQATRSTWYVVRQAAHAHAHAHTHTHIFTQAAHITRAHQGLILMAEDTSRPGGDGGGDMEEDVEIAPGVTRGDIYPFVYDETYPFVFCSVCESGSLCHRQARIFGRCTKSWCQRNSETKQRTRSGYSISVCRNGPVPASDSTTTAQPSLFTSL